MLTLLRSHLKMTAYEVSEISVVKETQFYSKFDMQHSLKRIYLKYLSIQNVETYSDR